MIVWNILTGFVQKLLGWGAGFNRTSNGAEIDLVLEQGQQKLAIECKASTSPRPSSGFYLAMEDLKIDKGWIIAPIVGDAYPLNDNVTVISLNDFLDITDKL